MLNTGTGEVVPAACKASFCGFCGPRNAYKVGLAIGLADPERHGRFSLVGDSWEVVRGRMARVKHGLGVLGYRFEWVWTVEANPRGTGHHAHFWQHGDYVPQPALQGVAAREGMGYPWIGRFQANRPSDGAQGPSAVTYGMKGVGYGLKGAAAVSGLPEHLRLNGGRLQHHSRGFFRQGEEQLTKVEAVDRAVRLVHGDELDCWVMRRCVPGR